MCATLDGDQLRCWGRFFGTDTSFADSVPIPANGVVQMVGGWSQECFLYEAGGVKCRGYAGPALGYGHDEDIGDDPDETLDDTPFVEVGDPVRKLSMFDHVVCAITQSGGVRCWGEGWPGQLGTGLELVEDFAIGDDDVPADYDPVRLAGGPVTEIAIGTYVTCGLHDSGDVSCWGYAIAPLGYGPAMNEIGENYGDDEHPDSLGFVPIGGKAIDIAATQTVTCALLESGDVKCWGTVAGGSLGYPGVTNIGESNTPADKPPIELGGKAIDLVSGTHHVCALLDDQNVRCWGDPTRAVLGYGAHEKIGDDETPAEAGDVPYLR
jgi:alpha-tubulin suppressor-like RCC1 family protein